MSDNVAEYKRQGDCLYKIVGHHMLEINMQSYDYGVIGLVYGDMRTSPLAPNIYAKKLSKKEFEKYYKIAIQKINLLK
jgi:hypothetical protein